MSTIWLEENLRSVDQYRSAYQLSQHRSIYGTEQPIALVTGSSSARVGNFVARYLLCHGYGVIFHARSSVEQGKAMVARCNDAGLPSMLVCGEIEQESQVQEWFNEIDSKFGRLDLVVQCAASWEKKTLEETTSDDYLRNAANHGLGAFLISKYAGLMMCKQPTGGSIVLTGDWALHRPYPGFSAYFAGKATIPTLTRTMAVELASRNPKIRCNCVLPGIVLLGGDMDSDKVKQLEEAALVDRIGTPLDIAKAVMGLAESTFITGESIYVDGGRHCYAGPGVDALAHPDS